MKIKEHINQELDQLTEEQLGEVNHFIKFLKFRDRFKNLPVNDLEKSADLYREFAQEDHNLAEEGMKDYIELLEQEDII